MKLYFRKLGSGQPIIILHGLYGASDNWMTIGRQLSENYEVWLLDLRNHGKSPHHNIHNYDVMKDDLHEFISRNKIENPVLVGHSMGGKVAMAFALSYPDLISRLIVIDIAPKSYLFSLDSLKGELNHKEILNALKSSGLDKFARREEILEDLIKRIGSTKISHFLMKNLKRDSEKRFNWILNIDALFNNLEDILDGFSEKDIDSNPASLGVPVLFIKGANSDYILEDDKDEIEDIFPYAQFKSIKNAGHWLHVEQPEQLIKVLTDFIER